MQITYKVDKLKSGGYMAYCPAMKPVVVHADTEQEAFRKLLSAAKLYVKRHPEFRNSLRTADLEE